MELKEAQKKIFQPFEIEVDDINKALAHYSKHFGIETKFLEELSVFYVAVTRARKQVYFSASQKQINSSGNEVDRKISCFMRLPGINIVNDNDD